MAQTLRRADPSQDLTLPALLLRNAEWYGDLPALSWRGPDAAWTSMTWAEARQVIVELAAGLAGVGVRRGERVLLMMANRPEHWLSDLAAVHLGAVPVSVYGTAAPEQIAHIVRHSGARVAIIDGARELERWGPLLVKEVGQLERLIVVDPIAADGAYPVMSYAAVLADGVHRHDPGSFDREWRQLRSSDPVTVVYTSGTTGDPKGVVATHRQVIRSGVGIDQKFIVPAHAAHICYLPFAHIAERMLGLYLPLLRASHVYFCGDPGDLAGTVRDVRPEEFFGVPRVWEKFTAAVRGAISQLPAQRQAAIEAANETARSWVAYRERAEEPPEALTTAYAEAKRDVLDPLLLLMGFDRLVWAVSAAAPMPQDVVRFWTGFGVVILDAWGMSETTGVCTLNHHAGFRLGSVGRPIDGIEVRIAADGEIEVRGELVCGYLQEDGSVQPLGGATGWFGTGDMGSLDEDGYLYVTDRKKELIITSTGKNVSPVLVENTLKEHPLIGQALVYGDRRSYLVALLVLDVDTATVWAARQGIEAEPVALPQHRAVLAEIDRAVAGANSRLNRTEMVKRYRLLDREWGPETGELTPSLKLRRRVVHARYAEVIAGMYEM
ncbi:AMP-dependent synthetase/ligase [Streptomyces zagrosensis]|uniref:Acyl-CoA synthetase n=1 Tax=Streptomyces zagrosensis TaxID=1042984 RepID=A0A7W9V0H0_9ACTN|nr:AMP-dependent synthetase/ligase [Streptomyces zagrosensis]MBB5937261.1 long-chain acyl-CoA synthetase [Streptomyces zagrosensis]